jgi:hypothetical protein
MSGIKGSADNSTGIVTTAGDGRALKVMSGIKGSAGIGIRRATQTGSGEPTPRNVGAGRARTRIVSIGNSTTIKITTMVPETANAATTEKTSAATLRHSGGGGSPMAYLS